MIDSVSKEADLKKARRARATLPMQVGLDRLPPHSLECEQGALGCVLLSPNTSMPEVVLKFGKSISEVMYDLRHQTILDELVMMYDEREAIDIITLQTRLKSKNLLSNVGGLAYLAGLPEKTPSAANLSYYMDHICEKLALRKILHACTRVAGRIYEHEGEVSELVDEVEREFSSGNIMPDARVGHTITQIVGDAINQIERASAAKDGLTGLSTGLTDLDRLTCGLQSAEMVVIAARPSTGKTSLGMGFVEHIALDLKLPVGVASLEMSATSLILRMMCSRGRVDSQRIRRGELSQSDFNKLTNAAAKIQSAKLYIDDTPAMTITQLRAKARRWKELHGIKVLLVDYLQLLHDRADSRQQEIAQISCGLKDIAKELNIPVIVLSQLNRDLEKGGKKPRAPRLSDIRESGAVEQDADVIGLLYKPDEDNEYLVKLDIAKQRNGPTGEVNLMFQKQYTRFENAAKVSDEDVP